MTANTFRPSVVAAIDASKILGVRAGDRSDHRFIGIWPVVIGGRVFGRSWSLKPGGRKIRINAVPARSTRIRDLVERVYAEKYPTPGSRHYVRGFRTTRRREATMEFLPR